MARVNGQKFHKKRLEAAKKAARNLTATLYSAGQEIELEAENSITQGSVSGKGHVPSKPGEPPNADTRFLDMNIETTIVSENPPTINVTSKAPYSVYLEYGTRNVSASPIGEPGIRMAARPFMRPATEKHRKTVSKMVAEAISIAVKRS